MQEFYRVKYYEVVDQLTEEISRCFDHVSLAFYVAIENILLEASNNLDDSPIKVPDTIGKRDINIKKLEKPQILPDLVSAYKPHKVKKFWRLPLFVFFVKLNPLKITILQHH